MKTDRIFALLLAVVMLLSVFAGCNTAESHVTDPGGSAESADTTGMAGSEPAGNEDEESTQPETKPTESTQPETKPTEPTHPETKPAEPTQPETKPTEPTQPETKPIEPTQPETKPTEPTQPETKPAEPATEPTECSHSWLEWTTDSAATCEANGTKSRKCSRCGHTQTETIAATGHNWDEGKVTTTPTSCSDMGVKTYTCKACGRTKTEQIKGDHTFGSWYYEEYEYEAYNAAGRLTTYTSHRKVRTCTKCGYKETGGTPDHRCTWDCRNHNVTVLEEATCTKGGLYRSTCTVCGWYEEQRSDETAAHSNKTETRHLTDYGDYTNELDVRISNCTVCGESSTTYIYGEGWSNYNPYHTRVVVQDGNSQKFSVEHPECQSVKRNFVYDSDGYVKQYTLYWWYNGTRYSQVINCDTDYLVALFAEYGLTVTDGVTCQFIISGSKVVPYKISWAG